MERRDFLRTAGKSGLSLLAGSSLAGLVSCESSIFEPSWVEFERIGPLPEFPRWWNEVSACSGFSGDFNRVTLYHVKQQDIPCVIDEQKKWCHGIWKEPHDIYYSSRLFEWYDKGPGTIDYQNAKKHFQHEMLHDLKGKRKEGEEVHPPIFKQCGVD